LLIEETLAFLRTAKILLASIGQENDAEIILD
jgi:hypothetical protein